MEELVRAGNCNRRLLNRWLFVVCAAAFLLTFIHGMLKYTGDIQGHTELALQFGDPNFSIWTVPYPIWHSFVYGVHTFLTHLFGSLPNTEALFPIISAALVSALFNVFTAIAIYAVTSSLLKAKQSVYVAIVIALLIVTPLYVPAFNPNLYLGQGSPTIWHNPTYNAVKATSLLSFFCFIHSYVLYSREIALQGDASSAKKRRPAMGYMAATAFLTAFSCFLKPSFVQAFLPTVLMFLMIELIVHRKRVRKFLLFSFLMFLPAVIILLIQFYLVYFGAASTDSESGISLGFFVVWSTQSPNIAISILLAVAFPLYALFVLRKEIYKNKYVFASAIFFVTALLEWGLLYETGPRAGHGNFGWAYLLGQFILWVFMSVCYVKHYLEEKHDGLSAKMKIQYVVGYVLMSLHVACGIYFYIAVLGTPGQ